MLKLSIIIVNWNSWDVLYGCLASIYRYITYDFEIITIDNNSTDGSGDNIKKMFPKVILLEKNENLGFSKANNIGFTNSKGNYILILNPDTKIVDDSMEKMLDFLEHNPNVGIVGPKLIERNGNISVHGKRAFPSLWSSFLALFLIQKFSIFIRRKLSLRSRFLARKIHAYYNKNGFVNSIEGSCMLMSRAVFGKLGGFDESVPMFLDDVDICYRSKKSGLKNYYLADASIYHIGRHSTDKTEKKRFIYELLLIYANIIFFKKHYGIFKLFILKVMIISSIPLLVVVDVISIPYYVLRKRINKPFMNLKKHFLYFDLVICKDFRYNLAD